MSKAKINVHIKVAKRNIQNDDILLEGENLNNVIQVKRNIKI